MQEAKGEIVNSTNSRMTAIVCHGPKDYRVETDRAADGRDRAR